MASLVIESMGHFMSDDSSDGAVIDRCIGFEIEKRWLQNSRRENDFVYAGIVIGINSLGKHMPFGFIDRFVDFFHITFDVKGPGVQNICNVGITGDSERRIIDPFFRVTDFYPDGVQFFKSFLLGDIAHPIQIIDAFGVSVLQIIDNIQRPFLCFGRKIFLHVKLPHGFS